MDEQVHRPLVLAGCEAHEVVTLTDWHVLPDAHWAKQPPQCDVFDEISTGEPPQQRCEATVSY